jgi:hypothetical protein
MSIYKSQGLQLAIASTFGTSVNMTALTNATEGVATLAASHGVAVADIIEVTSGWRRLTGRVVRAKTVVTNDVTLEGVNTTSTTNYPTGEGTGTVREISAWTSLSQVRRNLTSGGGGFEQDDITMIDDVRVKNRPGLAQPATLDLVAFFDPALAWVSVVRTAAQGGSPVPFRMTLSGGQKIYGNAYWGFNEEPGIQDNSLVYQLQLTMDADSITYTS